MSKYSENIPGDIKSAIGWMLDELEDDGPLLDVGCSTGYFGSFIKKTAGVQVYGVEVSKDAEKARKVLDGVYSFDLEKEWPSEVYERDYKYIFFGDVLEHLKDPEKVLKQASKLLKKNGKVFVSIPNIAHMSIRLELLAGNFQYEKMGILDNTHLKYFTKNSFSGIAQAAGYNIKSINYTLDEYPSRFIKKQVEKSGLKTTDKFWSLADKVEARAYQYKFVLTLQDEHSAGKELLVPEPKKPVLERDNFTNDLQHQVKNLRKHAQEQAKIIDHQRKEIKELNRIWYSAPRKAINAVSIIKRKIINKN